MKYQDKQTGEVVTAQRFFESDFYLGQHPREVILHNFHYFKVSNGQTLTDIKDGDWVIRQEGQMYATVMSDSEFREQFEEIE